MDAMVHVNQLGLVCGWASLRPPAMWSGLFAGGRAYKRFPLIGFCRMKYCFDSLHVTNGVFNRRRDGSVIKDCAGKQISLDCILVTNIEFDFFNHRILILKPQATRLSGRCIKWDFYFNAASVTKNLDSLIGCHLCRARKCGRSVAEIHDRARENIRFEVGVKLGYSRYS